MSNKTQKKRQNHTERAIYIHLLKPIALISLIFMGISSYFQKWDFVYACLLGLGVSFITFRQLIKAQALLLYEGKSQKVFILYLLRLGLIAVPIILALKFKDTFNLWITLIFLFTFQVAFVIDGFLKNYRKARKQIDKWTKLDK